MVASKTVTADANKDVASLRNVTATGVATVGSVVVADGGNIGAASDTDSLAIASNGVVTFSQAPVFPDGSIAVADLDIDGGTDIGAALVDADLMIVDDGAGGTNRKATMARLATYMGTKITGGSKVFIASSGALSNVASVQFRAQDGHFDDTKYDHYEFMFQAVIPATDNVYFHCQTSTNDGSAYASTSGDYHSGNNTDQIGLIASTRLGSDTNEYGVSGTFQLLNPHLNTYTMGNSLALYVYTTGGIFSNSGDGNGASARLSAEDTDAVKFIMSSGNIESGEIVMYGIANGS